MKQASLYPFIITAISYAFIVLFTYAAVSKLLDFENFQVQLGQSPLLAAFSEYIVWIIPLLEILIAIGLSINKYRKAALFSAYTLMIMFTAYIYIILHHSSFIPCSCGGVLEKMSWNQHLIFNAIFIILALLGILILDNPKSIYRKKIQWLFVLGFLGIFSVVLLFNLSENKIRYNNAFTRRIPHNPIKKLNGISLKHNSFYIAGYVNGIIYLGNNTAPKYILSIDSSLTKQKAIRIDQDNHNFLFTTAQVKVKDNYYYFADGTLPVIYRGTTKDWKGSPIYNGTTKFSIYEVIDTSRFIVRTPHPKTGENYLALIDIYNNKTFYSENNILKKQIDGIFDTDGLLSHNPILNVSLYTYYYRNQYLLFKPTLDSIIQSKTIDTLQQVSLQFAYLNSKREKKFATQPEKINTYATTSGKYLYIKSKRLGKYDRSEMLKQACFIDVYNLENNSYIFSFYFYNYNGEEIKSFKIYDDILIGLTERYLVVGKFRKERFNPLK